MNYELYIHLQYTKMIKAILRTPAHLMRQKLFMTCVRSHYDAHSYSLILRRYWADYQQNPRKKPYDKLF